MNVSIASSDLVLVGAGSGAVITSGVKNNVFPDGRLGDGNIYRLVEVRNNNASLTLSSVKAWVYNDPAGGSWAIALGYSSAIPNANDWDSTIDASSLTYSTPTSMSSGLSLPTLAAGNKALIAIRRSLASGSTAYPEKNALYVGGSSPI